MSVFLLNRSPEPAETGVPIDEEIFLEIVDDSGADIDLSATQVYLASEGGGEVLAFDAGVFQPGFNGPNSATSSFATGIRRIRIDVQSAFVSLEEFTVHVLSANDDGTPVTLDATYTFFVEDLTAPVVLTAEGRDLQVVRVTFDEPVLQVAAANADDSLNPANYAFTRLTAPSVSVVATSVAAVSGSTVDVTVDIELSPGRQYRVNVANVEDLKGNAVAAPFDFALFIAFEPPEPATRDFCLYEMLPLMNRLEDRSGDLAKFIAVLQEPVDLLLYDIDQFIDILDPDTAPEQYVNAMLADLCAPFSFIPSLALVDKRRLIHVLLDIYKLKGTCVGIIDAVRFFLGLEVDCDEFIDGETLILGESELGSDGTDGDWVLGASAGFLLYSFTITSVITLTQDQKDKITEIVEFMKPAHTHFLGFVEPTAPVIIDHLELGLSELGVEWELH
jgi:phage tail-like protein